MKKFRTSFITQDEFDDVEFLTRFVNSDSLRIEELDAFSLLIIFTGLVFKLLK